MPLARPFSVMQCCFALNRSVPREASSLTAPPSVSWPIRPLCGSLAVHYFAAWALPTRLRVHQCSSRDFNLVSDPFGTIGLICPSRGGSSRPPFLPAPWVITPGRTPTLKLHAECLSKLYSIVRQAGSQLSDVFPVEFSTGIRPRSSTDDLPFHPFQTGYRPPAFAASTPSW